MRDFLSLKELMYSWIYNQNLVKPESIMFKYQNVPTPDTPYFSLQMTSFLKLGRDILVGLDEFNEYQLQGTREFTLSISGFGDGIIEKTNTLRDSLEIETVLQFLYDGGLIPYEPNLPVQDVSGVDESENEERSSYDVLMRTDSVITNIPVEVFTQVNAEGTFSQSGKSDITEQINIGG